MSFETDCSWPRTQDQRPASLIFYSSSLENLTLKLRLKGYRLATLPYANTQRCNVQALVRLKIHFNNIITFIIDFTNRHHKCRRGGQKNKPIIMTKQLFCPPGQLHSHTMKWVSYYHLKFIGVLLYYLICSCKLFNRQHTAVAKKHNHEERAKNGKHVAQSSSREIHHTGRNSHYTRKSMTPTYIVVVLKCFVIN